MLWRRLAELQVAVMLLTRLPAGEIKGEAPDLASARWVFPFVGGLIGLMTWSVYAGALTLGAPPAVAALLALAGLALVTGAVHLDGLADYADGIGGGRDKAHALEIMRDSRVGTYGVLALIMVAGLWTASVAAASPGVITFVGAAVLSRASMTALQDMLPPAREDGMARIAAGDSSAARAVLVILFAAALLLWLVPLIACITTTALVAYQARKKIGGQTGDVLGAAQVLSETAIWIVLASSVP